MDPFPIRPFRDQRFLCNSGHLKGFGIGQQGVAGEISKNYGIVRGDGIDIGFTRQPGRIIFTLLKGSLIPPKPRIHSPGFTSLLFDEGLRPYPEWTL